MSERRPGMYWVRWAFDGDIWPALYHGDGIWYHLRTDPGRERGDVPAEIFELVTRTPAPAGEVEAAVTRLQTVAADLTEDGNAMADQGDVRAEGLYIYAREVQAIHDTLAAAATRAAQERRAAWQKLGEPAPEPQLDPRA